VRLAPEGVVTRLFRDSVSSTSPPARRELRGTAVRRRTQSLVRDACALTQPVAKFRADAVSEEGRVTTPSACETHAPAARRLGSGLPLVPGGQSFCFSVPGRRRSSGPRSRVTRSRLGSLAGPRWHGPTWRDDPQLPVAWGSAPRWHGPTWMGRPRCAVAWGSELLFSVPGEDRSSGPGHGDPVSPGQSRRPALARPYMDGTTGGLRRRLGVSGAVAWGQSFCFCPGKNRSSGPVTVTRLAWAVSPAPRWHGPT